MNVSQNDGSRSEPGSPREPDSPRDGAAGTPAPADPSSPDPSSPETPAPRAASRWRRRGRRAGRVLVVVLVIAGVWSIGSAVLGPPGVGHFRSAAGRAAYVQAYDRAMAQLPEPTAQYDIQTDFGVVRAYEWSTDETARTTPVVLLPGRSSGVPMWSVNLAGFAAGHRVIAFDALGDAGMSVQSSPLTSMEDQAEWIDQVLRVLAPDGVHLVGHSFGGATATAYARIHPERVRSLALLEPVFTFGYPPTRFMAWAMVASLPLIPEGVREHALGRIGGADGGAESQDPTAVMIRLGTRHYSADLPTPSLLSEDGASTMTMPVYVAIAGRESLAGGERAARRAQELLPRATVKTWPDTTHSLPMQEPEALGRELEELWSAAG